MYGQQPHLGPGGGGGGVAAPHLPPPLQQQLHMDRNLFLNHNHLLFLQQNPSLLAQHQLNPFLQIHNGFPPIQQQIPKTNLPVQLIPENGSFQAHHHPNECENDNTISPQQQVRTQSEMIEEVDMAARKAWKDLLKSNESVSAWQVSQEALLAVKADSWESLGFQMQLVPSLRSLLAVEGKINAFIHCFVAARRITSLYDLEVAICESEGVEHFEDLQLGPLLQHPLAVYYFYLTSNVTKVCRITTEEIMSHLCEFIDTHIGKEHNLGSFMDFICKKKSVSCWENLCVRVRNFRLYARIVKQTKQKPSEDSILEQCLPKLKPDSVKHSTKRSRKSFSSETTQYGGTHIRFCSDDDDSEEDDSLPNGRPETREVERCDMDSKKHSRHKKRKENTSSKTLLPKKEKKADVDVDPDVDCESNHEPYWPPSDWKSAPGFKPVSRDIKIESDIRLNEFNKEVNSIPVEESILPTNLNVVFDSVDFVSPDSKNLTPNCAKNDQLLSEQAVITGRLGEHVAFKYFAENAGEKRSVKWVNEADETGLPYDIILEGDGKATEYIEVKATRIRRKDWFMVTIREWQFAMEKGESFSIAHVVLADDDMAKVVIYKNPARLCQLGNLKLALLVPK